MKHMKRIKLFEQFNVNVNEAWSLSRDAQYNTFLIAKKEGSISTSGSFQPLVRPDQEPINFVPGDILMVVRQSGSVGTLYQFHKVEITGDKIEFLSDQVSVMKLEYGSLFDEPYYKRHFDRYNPNKK